MRQPFSADERSRLIETCRTAIGAYHDRMSVIAECGPGSSVESAALDAAQSHLAAATAAEREYVERLPRVVMSCCPFDGRPLVRTFDAYGFDGLWWQAASQAEEVPSCPHFCFVRGAIERRSPEALAAERDEPEAPYVIPRILAKPGVVAVISQLEMRSGDRVFVTAYFARQRPAPQDLAASWPRRQYLYTTALGQHRWRFESETRDFDLRPWLADRKIEWCEPGSGNAVLSTQSRECCPYVGMRRSPNGRDAETRPVRVSA